jgi:hypothetical protein
LNQKRPYKSDWEPEFHHQVVIKRGLHQYLISVGTLISVIRKPGLIAGKYAFRYAEYSKDGTLLMTVEGPDSRIVSQRRMKVIRECDIKQVHLSTRRRE